MSQCIIACSAILSLLFLLSSCASVNRSDGCDVISESGMPVLHGSQLGEDFIRTQNVRIISKTDVFQFISQIELRNGKLTLVAMTPIGQKLFQIIYKDGDIDFEKYGIPVKFNPAYFLSDIGLIYAPPQNIRRCLSVHTASIEMAELTPATRLFRNSVNQKIRIHYEQPDKTNKEHIEYNNEIRGYRIIIDTLEIEKLY